MSRKTVRGAAAGIVVTLAAFASACGSSAPGGDAGRIVDATPARGGTLVVGSISDVDSWNEYLSHQTFANNLHRRIFLRLAVERGDTSEHPPTFEPQLAESWTFGDDGLSLTFVLREAVWSDGTPVTASDVRFTWLAQTAPEVAWIGAEAKGRIVDVVVVDARTVTFCFDSVYPYRLADAVEGGILPEHVYGPVPFEAWRTHDWSDTRIASGPFVLERHVPAQEIVLRRNERYGREGFPRVDAVTVRIVPDASSLVTQLLAGAVDYVEATPPDVEAAAGDPRVRLVPFDYPMFDYVGWNTSRPPFDDPEIRRALTLGIDRDALVEELLGGYGRVGTGPVLSWWWMADRSIEPWPHDPDRSRRILASKGYSPEGPDGMLARDGAPLRFEILTNAGNGLRESALVKIQEQLRRIGVEARPRPLEMQTFRSLAMKGDFDAYVGGWRMTGRVDLRPLFGSEAVPPAGGNVVRYRSEEVDRLLTTLESASDWTGMKPAFDAIQRRLHEDQPYTFLYEAQRVAVLGPALHGVHFRVPSDPLAHLEECWLRR